MSEDLTQKKCIPCTAGGEALSKERVSELLSEVPGWEVKENLEIKKDYEFKDFKENIAFVNKVAELAEREGHHPDMNIHAWNKLTITLSTHAVKGLTENDFILASKMDLALRKT